MSNHDDSLVVSYNYRLLDLPLVEKACAACFEWVSQRVSGDSPF